MNPYPAQLSTRNRQTGTSLNLSPGERSPATMITDYYPAKTACDRP
jgi:hypothetical protein